MQSFFKITGSLLIVGLLATPVLAQEGPPPGDDMTMDEAGWHDGRHHGGKHGGKHGRKHGRMMQIIDANGDGIIGEDEAATLADGMFMRMDDDGNGALSEMEFVSGPQHHRRGWFSWAKDEAAAVEKVRKDKFASLDTDKNASLSKAEFFVEAKAKFASADADKDGKISPWEFRAGN